MSNQCVYIVDTYSKYENDDVVELFNVNSHWYAIKRVQLNFGRPILSNIEKNENEYLQYHIYEDVEEAKAYVRALKYWEGRHF